MNEVKTARTKIETHCLPEKPGATVAQRYCATVAGVSLRTWQRWENADTKPHPHHWEAFKREILNRGLEL